MNIKCILDKDVHRINDTEDLEPVPIGCESVYFTVHFEIAMYILHLKKHPKNGIILRMLLVPRGQYEICKMEGQGRTPLLSFPELG